MISILAQDTWLSWVIGNDPTRAGTPRLQWANFPESWGVFVLLAFLAALAYGVFWLYRNEISTCSPRLKMFLAALRLSALLMLIAMFLKPSVFYQQISETKPTIAVLRDSSLSIDRGDRYRETEQAQRLARASGLNESDIQNGTIKRSRILNEIVRKNPAAVEEMRKRGSLRIVDFADGNSPVAMIPAIVKDETKSRREKDGAKGSAAESPESGDVDRSEPDDLIKNEIPPLVPEGLGTDIWLALKETLDDSTRLSSIVLVSDGQHNGSEDPLELARKAATLDKPIYVIGVGDPNPPKNLAVTDVYSRDKAYPDEPIEIEAILQSSQVGELGMPAEVTVQLVQQPVDPKTRELGAAEAVGSKTVKLPSAGGRTRVEFEHTMNRPGNYVFSVITEPIANETESSDNRKSAPEMEVIDEKIRVLLISGLPNWDYQHVQRLLERDSSISVSCWLQSMDESRPQEGNEPISRLPRSLEELGKFNIVIMIDPNPAEFDKAWMDLLQDFARHKAGGVLYMAGPQFTSEFLTMNRLAGIREILPVKFGNNEFIDSIQALADAKDLAPGKMIPVGHNLNHPVMSFRNDTAMNQKIWSEMPSLPWSFPTLSAKPTARVLLERGDTANAEGNQPLMVAGRYGAGSVLYLGFHGSWLWRTVGVQAQYFDRFWIQVVRYLVETRSLQGSRRGYVDLEKTEFELGNRVNLMARVLDAQFQPSQLPEIQAVIQSGDGRLQKVPLKLIPEQEGRYEGSFVAQRTGNYVVNLDLGPDGEKAIDPVPFRIVMPSSEAASFWLNEKLLKEIAELSGGKYYRVEDFGSVAVDLPDLTTRAEFNGPPEPLWDVSPFMRWLAWLLPVVLLSLEWGIRKWQKLL